MTRALMIPAVSPCSGGVNATSVAHSAQIVTDADVNIPTRSNGDHAAGNCGGSHRHPSRTIALTSMRAGIACIEAAKSGMDANPAAAGTMVVGTVTIKPPAIPPKRSTMTVAKTATTPAASPASAAAPHAADITLRTAISGVQR